MTNLKNFRIKKEIKFGKSRYYPQQKILFWWFDIFSCEPYNDGSFYSFERAQEELCEYIAENKVEYLEVDCSKCEDTSKTAPPTPNPPPKVV